MNPSRGAAGASGALVQGDACLPAKAGPIVCLAVPDVPNTPEAAAQAGGRYNAGGCTA